MLTWFIGLDGARSLANPRTDTIAWEPNSPFLALGTRPLHKLESSVMEHLEACYDYNSPASQPEDFESELVAAKGMSVLDLMEHLSVIRQKLK